MSGYLMLVGGSIAFVGSHFLMSHSWRARMVRRFGDNGFLGVYSVVSAITLAIMIWGFVSAPGGAPLWSFGNWARGLATLVGLIAMILFAGSLSGNPAMPSPEAERFAARKASGVFLVTRHPMMWSFALLALAHIFILPRPDMLIFAGSFAILALFGARAQDRKKAGQLGALWDTWSRQTSFLPRLQALPRVGPGPAVIGVVLWLIATWAHGFLGVAPVGLFHWF